MKLADLNVGQEFTLSTWSLATHWIKVEGHVTPVKQWNCHAKGDSTAIVWVDYDKEVFLVEEKKPLTFGDLKPGQKFSVPNYGEYIKVITNSYRANCVNTSNYRLGWVEDTRKVYLVEDTPVEVASVEVKDEWEYKIHYIDVANCLKDKLDEAGAKG